ncbi:histidine phosphatase family protein [Actinomadura sp. ATCC 39365]
MFFVRHGDSLHKQEGVIGGPKGCRGLTETGHQQAARLGRRIAAEIGDDTTTVYSSPLPRAVQTAAAIATAGPRHSTAGSARGTHRRRRTDSPTVIVVGHAETVEISFNALGLLPVYRSFDLKVSPASVTEWVTDEEPAQWPPPRWTRVRFNETPALGGGAAAPG